MTDITALAQREKFEAWLEEAEALPWGYLKKRRTSDDAYHEPNTTDMWGAWQAASVEMVEALEKAQAISAAAEKMVRCKGRYHSEQNYRALAALFGVKNPDLPPLESRKAPVARVMHRGIELVTREGLELIRDGISQATDLEITAMAEALLSVQSLTAAGIQVIEGEGQ